MKITPDHLLDLSFRAARRGNTRAMAQAAQASGATCYTITEREAARVRREYGVEAHSLSDYSPKQEAGRRTPVLLDVAVLPTIAEAWSAEVGAAEQRARQLTDELATSKAAHARDQKHLQRALAELKKLRTTSLSDDMRKLIDEVQRPPPRHWEQMPWADIRARIDAALALAAEVERLSARLAEFEDDALKVLGEPCASDERHCSCVPHLRARIVEVERANGEARVMRRVAEQETRTVADHGQQLIDNARAEATEARLALAAEQGQQEGAPSAGWRWTGKVWFHPPTCMVVEPVGRLWRLNPDESDPRHWRLSRLEPMPARDAMKTADAPN